MCGHVPGVGLGGMCYTSNLALSTTTLAYSRLYEHRHGWYRKLGVLVGIAQSSLVFVGEADVWLYDSKTSNPALPLSLILVVRHRYSEGNGHVLLGKFCRTAVGSLCATDGRFCRQARGGGVSTLESTVVRRRLYQYEMFPLLVFGQYQRHNYSLCKSGTSGKARPPTTSAQPR